MAEVRRSHGLHANPFLLYPQVIVSMAWLPKVRAQRLLRGVYAQTSSPKSGKRFAFDVLIVDEAHHVAPSSPNAVASGRGYAVDTQRTSATCNLRFERHFSRLLARVPAGAVSSFSAQTRTLTRRRAGCVRFGQLARQLSS